VPRAIDVPALLRCLAEGVVERDRALRISLLGALAGENVLLLGPPGTAKSLVARRLAAVFRGSRYFQYLLTRFTSPDELFGPVSLRQLKDHDEFSRKIDGYLPTAQVAFIDEIFKASSAILNSLLTIINERLYFNGGRVVPVPLLVLVAASNEVPDEEELVALYDRFAVRIDVHPIVDAEHVLQMLRQPDSSREFMVPDELLLTEEDVAAIRLRSSAIPLAPAVERLFLRVKRELDELAEGEEVWRWYVSDRRWKQAVRLLRTAAALCGRTEVHLVDGGLLRNCLWNRPEDAEALGRKVDLALEEAATTDLDLRPVATRWVQLLGRMRDREGVGRPIYDGYVLTHAGTRYVMTDLRAAATMKNSWDSVRTGFWFESRSNAVRRLKLRPDGAVMFHAGYNAVPVLDQAGFHAQVRAGNSPVLEEGSVSVDRKINPGIALDFSGVDGELQAEWLKELSGLRELLDDRRESLGLLGADVDAVVRGHLFVAESDVRGLRAGLLRTELVLREWDSKLRALEDALSEQQEYETADIDAEAPVTAESATRLLGVRSGGARR